MARQTSTAAQASTDEVVTTDALTEATEQDVIEVPASEERFDGGTESATEGETPVEETPATEGETPAEPSKPAEADFTAFNQAVEQAKASADAQTGQPSAEAITAVQQAYADLDGAKAKGEARKLVESAVHDAVRGNDLMSAKALMEVSEQMKQGAAKKAASTSKPAEPVDPAEALIQRKVILTLALASVPDPDGLTEANQGKIDERYSSLWADTATAIEWLSKPKDERGDQPEVNADALAAAKLALGTSAKAGGTKKAAASTGDKATYNGPRRSIKKHIAEAFASQPVGKHLKVNEIVKFTSAEYGDEHPSAGAVSASLKSPKFSDDETKGIEPGDNSDGSFGATKVA